MAQKAAAPKEMWLYRIPKSIPPAMLGEKHAVLTQETRLAVRKWLGET